MHFPFTQFYLITEISTDTTPLKISNTAQTTADILTISFVFLVLTVTTLDLFRNFALLFVNAVFRHIAAHH